MWFCSGAPDIHQRSLEVNTPVSAPDHDTGTGGGPGALHCGFPLIPGGSAKCSGYSLLGFVCKSRICARDIWFGGKASLLYILGSNMFFMTTYLSTAIKTQHVHNGVGTYSANCNLSTAHSSMGAN